MPRVPRRTRPSPMPEREEQVPLTRRRCNGDAREGASPRPSSPMTTTGTSHRPSRRCSMRSTTWWSIRLKPRVWNARRPRDGRHLRACPRCRANRRQQVPRREHRCRVRRQMAPMSWSWRIGWNRWGIRRMNPYRVHLRLGRSLPCRRDPRASPWCRANRRKREPRRERRCRVRRQMAPTSWSWRIGWPIWGTRPPLQSAICPRACPRCLVKHQQRAFDRAHRWPMGRRIAMMVWSWRIG